MAMMNANAEAARRRSGCRSSTASQAISALIAILAALRKRDATGRGEHLDVSMLDAALKLIATGVSVYSYTGEAPKGTGNRGYQAGRDGRISIRPPTAGSRSARITSTRSRRCFARSAMPR